MFNFRTKLLSAIFVCLVLAAVASAEFFSDVILTGTNGIWVDSRSYVSLQAAITAVGADDREIAIIGAQAATTLTVPANVRLRFLRDGSISNSGQLNINTRNIAAEDRQIFTGAGDIDFVDGSVVRSSWFSDIVEALDVTSDDTLTMVISEPGHITANAAVGDDVTLRWESSYNLLIAYGGRVLSNVRNIEAGNYQIFAGAGDIDFLDGTELYLSWFRRLRSVLTWVETEDVVVIVSEDSAVEYTQASASNETIRVLPGGMLSPSGGITLTIGGPFEAGIERTFSGAGTVVFGAGFVDLVNREIYPQWWGATGDGVTDDSTAMQAAATAATGRVLRIPTGTYVTDQIVLGNDTIVDCQGMAAILKGRANMAGSSAVLSIGNPSKHGVVVRNLAIDGNKANQVNTVYGIAIGDDSYNCKVINCHIYDTSGSCIALSGYDHLIEGNRLHGSKLNAIMAVATDAHDIYGLAIEKNWIYDLTVDGAGIELDEGVHDSSIRGNSVWDCISNGIEAENGCYNIVISGNVVYRTTAAGVGAYGILIGLSSTSRVPTIAATNITVTGNIVRNWYRGIYVDTMTMATVTDNQSFFNDNDGIAVTGVSHSVISNNKAVNNGQSFANRYGLLFTNVDYSSVIGNLACDTEAGGARTQDRGMSFDAASSYITLLGNIAYNNITSDITSAVATGKIAANIGYNRTYLDQYQYSGIHMVERIVPWTITFTDGDATPDVSGGNNFKTGCTVPTNVIDFDGQLSGQEITITGADGGNTTIVDNPALINLVGGANFTLGNNDTLKLSHDGADWNEVSRSDN